MRAPTRQYPRAFAALSLSALTLALLTPTNAAAQEKESTRESFRAIAMSMGNIGTGGVTTFDIHIDRWTTDDERNALIATLVENGPEKMFDALQKEEKAGHLYFSGPGARFMSFPSVDLRFARDIRADGKRLIRLATDRPVAFREAVYGMRSRDYAFTLLELVLDDEKDEGTGVLAVGVQINYDKEKNALVLEHYSSEPVRLTKVTRIK